MLKKPIFIVIVIFMMISMAACAPKKHGDFYTLQEAYDQGLLTVDDLKSIAYYHNGGSEDENFEPMPKTPEVLSKKTEKAIKETRAYDLRNPIPESKRKPIEKAKAKDIIIRKYHGTYKDCAAVMLTDVFGGYITMQKEVTIGEVVFYYGDANRILIWKRK